MGQIHTLSAEVIDQIAAGEVVERPAQMIKELVENSLDAGATAITVDFSAGGQVVRVTDNGIGISKEDLPKAFARHATSKITRSEDLWTLTSFGFRGEALASLAAVSKVKLVSRVANADTGYQLSGAFGEFTVLEPSGADFGTDIWVEGLFDNVPARKKFLKSDAAETTQIKMVLKAMALANHQVSFRVLSQGKLIYWWPATVEAKERAEQVLGVNPLYYGSGECERVRSEVYVSSPENVENGRRNIWVFAQNRWVQDKAIQAAVLDAYRGLLMHNEYPAAVVFINTCPEDVDVNVHPTKSQVRFVDPSSAFRSVHRAVRGVLETAPWLERILNTTTPTSSTLDNRRSQTETQVANLSFSGHEFSSTQWQQKMTAPKIEGVEPQLISNESVVFSEPSKLFAKVNEVNPSPRWSQLQVLGQAALTYIITQSERSLILIDQHAAHERVAYERILKSWHSGEVDAQSLLLPISVVLDAEAVERILAYRHELKKLGMEVEATGPEAIAVSAYPSMMNDNSVTKLIEKLAQDLKEMGDSFAFEKSLGELAATMACHSVIRAGQALSIEEMKSLLIAMDEFPLSCFCPHGRPVFVELTFAKLERDFGRIV